VPLLRAYARDALSATLDHYKDKVRIVYKDNPLIPLHPWAMRAAIDSDCLAAQNSDAYWQYVDYIHAHGQEVNGDSQTCPRALTRWTASPPAGHAEQTGRRPPDACLAHQDETQVRASMKRQKLSGSKERPRSSWTASASAELFRICRLGGDRSRSARGRSGAAASASHRSQVVFYNFRRILMHLACLIEFGVCSVIFHITSRLGIYS